MSVQISNRYAFLDEDREATPAPAKKAAAAPTPAAAPAAAPAKQTRGDYPSRGQGRKVYQGDRAEQNVGDAQATEGKEERAPRGARDGRGGRGGPRGGGGRGGANPRSNGGTYLGGDRPRRENGGGRVFDRHSQTGRQDTDKPAEEGKEELAAEVAGEADAQAEAVTPGAATPDVPAERSSRPPREEEEEDNTQTYDEYLAAQAAKKLNLASLPEARAANEGADDAAWKNTVALAKKGEAEEEWFFGKKPAEAPKARKQKEQKTFIEIETSYKPPRRDGPPRGDGDRPTRGGRGGARGGARGGERRGGAGAGGAPRAPRQAQVNVEDNKAFPALA